MHGHRGAARRLNEFGAEVLSMPAGERKISEVFLEFADPVLDLLAAPPAAHGVASSSRR